MHTPVLLKEVIEALQVKPGGLYIDATVGEGGHAKALLEKGAMVLAIDWDEDQVKKLAKTMNNKDLTFTTGNFGDIESLAKKNKFYSVDGVLFDLGLSMAQLAQSGRGFSFKNSDEPLDMRISTKSANTAEEILNLYGEQELYDFFARYGEDVHSETLAKAIVHTRIEHKFKTVADLVSVINETLTECKQGHYHNFNQTASRIFQAIRMMVNDEVDNLKKGLAGAVNIVNQDGKIAVITFHSVEDRLVKQFIRDHDVKAVYELTNNKSKQTFERSAKLRVFTKVS